MSAALLGFVLGCVFGAAAQRGRFCLLRGLKGIGPGQDRSALQAFALAMATAVACVQILAATGIVPINEALPIVATNSWLSILLGGVIFGLGMAMANACGARSIVLLASGNLRSAIVIVCIGVAAQASLTGILAGARRGAQQMMQGSAAGTLPQALSEFGVSGNAAVALSVVPLLALLLWFGWPLVRPRPVEAAMAVIVGVCIAAGWWITTATNDPFDPKPLTSISFVAPLGDSLLWVMLSTGRAATFAVAVVAGTLAGALVSAVTSGGFHINGVGTPRQAVTAAIGGILMGFGGVMALGCSIGQGLSGVSTLSLGSFVALSGIILGALGGLFLFPQRTTTGVTTA